MGVYTDMLTGKINDWGLDKISEIEDNLSSLEDNVPEIVKYLNDIHFAMPLGLALRRFMCEKYSDSFSEEEQVYIFNLDGKIIKTHNYAKYFDDFDITSHELKEYCKIFDFINRKFNCDKNGCLVLNITSVEIKRQLKSVVCTRKKMFEISFALHMEAEETKKFLTDVLAEQIYNYREPEEIIAEFCQTHEEYNFYCEYIRLCELFKEKSKDFVSTQPIVNGFTLFVRNKMKDIKSENELMDFLMGNVQNFHKYSETAYKEFMRLYKKAMDDTKVQALSNDELNFPSDESPEKKKERIETAISLKTAANPEQLAGEILACIPRATENKTNDFININTSDTEKRTTTLPKSIVKNLPISDRLWDLIRGDKPVGRKDLVFMKFYVFSLYLQTQDDYSYDDYVTFVDECNDMLLRCGMSKLYPGNRFENLVLLSLLAENPYEMFEMIIEYSFMNEPHYQENE